MCFSASPSVAYGARCRERRDRRLLSSSSSVRAACGARYFVLRGRRARSRRDATRRDATRREDVTTGRFGRTSGAARRDRASPSWRHERRCTREKTETVRALFGVAWDEDEAMDAWMYDVVCMMSDATTESMIGNNRTMPNIKQEIDNPTTPTQNYQVCSPTTTLQHQESICTKIDIATDYGGSNGSPESPEMHHCSSTTQPLGTPEDGVKEEDIIPRRLCLVCGDVASGFHYGVASCEACKAFFKRTIQGNIEYTCPANGECEINKRRRKACQACRFQKCLRQGMLKEGVRLDRVRGGRQKYRRSTDPYTPVKNATLEDNKMVEALMACEPDILQVSNIPNTLEMDQKVLGQLSDLYDRELVGIIGWAKQIPGFSSLALNDQMRLLQSTWAEILTFTLAWRSTPNTGRLRFAQDFTLDERLARECHCMELYTHCIQIVERIQRLGLTREEYYVLKALILANSDARSDEPQALYRFRDSILNSLSDCVAAVRPGQALRATQNMLLVLPSLRQADGIVRRFWSSVYKTGKVPMNKLFEEMLENVCYR